jgi:hypothetical protein
MMTNRDELYSVRWKKQDKELEMLVSRMGTPQSYKCSVMADLKPFVHEYEDGKIVTKQWRSRSAR